MKMQLPGRVAGMIVLLMLCVGAASAQTPSAPNASQPAGQEAPNEGMPVALTLKRAIELALQNSKEIQVAKIQASVADRAAQITKAQFMPNLYAGSGAGYTYGIPETPGGRAPFAGAVAQRAGERGKNSASDAGTARGRIRTAGGSDESTTHKSASGRANLAARRPRR